MVWVVMLFLSIFKFHSKSLRIAFSPIETNLVVQETVPVLLVPSFDRCKTRSHTVIQSSIYKKSRCHLQGFLYPKDTHDFSILELCLSRHIFVILNTCYMLT